MYPLTISRRVLFESTEPLASFTRQQAHRPVPDLTLLFFNPA